MILNFDKDSVKEWADFSGDFNPIHFDVLKARQIGLNDLAVHGMLAMLPLKQHTTDLFLKELVGGYCWSSSLRYPLGINNDYELLLKSSDNKITFSLNDMQSTKKYFIGRIQTNNFDQTLQEFDFSNAHQFTIPSDFIKQKFSEFQKKFTEISFLWIYFDALIFSIYLEKHASKLFTESLKKFMGKQKQFIDNDVLLLHTNHKVYVSNDIGKLNLVNISETVSYSLMINDVAQQENSLSISLTIPVWVENKISIIITMNIMGIKTYNQIKEKD
ncbi:hypothetical protein B6D22_01750 [Gilliamella apicola]|uniref:MaoC/PaaZ C-terminal domain-containing protein n=2 Tax=Gilliamella apicola TaxID=1196095 RepID=UPI000A331AF9|nr:MaoC/PaaZ C-terminal domain-containing protein [Gilliamella apicola]OTQ25661.1 hypothetical protein B6D22_01750 [Gilliamella apicola]